MTLRLVIAVAALIAFVPPFTASCSAQGQVHFNNRVPPGINARFGCPEWGIPYLGPDFTAQLFGGPAGSSISQLTALLPVTTFRTGAGAGYVVPIDVTVPGVAPGAEATFVMRAFNGRSFHESTIRAETPPITITVGGGILPPANLVGLQSPPCIPGPRTTLLLTSGLLCLSMAALRRNAGGF